MKTGWIGTGIMGAAMCGRLLDAGVDCTIFSRTRAKAEALLGRGAHWAETPADVARAADVVFTMVGYPADVEEVVLAPESGVLAGFRQQSAGARILVDMTTSRPALAEKIAQIAQSDGVRTLDAPVSGGDVGARNGTLSIMVGGDRSAFDALAELWPRLGTARFLGPAGAGQHTKMVNQILIAGNMLGVCEALRYTRTVGLEAGRVLEAVASGAAGSWSLDNLAPRILAENFAPGFKIHHFVKDLRIALDEARARSLPLPGVELAERLYTQLAESGLADAGTQALVKWGDVLSPN